MLYTCQKLTNEKKKKKKKSNVFFGDLICANEEFHLNHLLIREINIFMSKTRSMCKLFTSVIPWKPRVIWVLQNNTVLLQVSNLRF